MNFSNEIPIIYMDEIRGPSIPLIGGKAAGLFMLKENNLPVPPFYCIPVQLHAYYQSNNDLPASFIRNITEIFKKLDGRVAVRSSALQEDGAQYSFAGIFRTVYVKNADHLPHAIKEVLNSAGSSALHTYCRQHRINPDAIRMAVIIQQLIDAPDISGVIFTGVNDREDTIYMEYGTGSCEKIVDGRMLGNKIMIAGGRMADHVKMPGVAGLNEHEIHRLKNYAAQIMRAAQNKRVDIEFVLKNQQIYILQARPISRINEKVNTENSLVVFAQGKPVKGELLIVDDKSRDHTYYEQLRKKIGVLKKKGAAVIIAAEMANIFLDPLIELADAVIIGTAGMVAHISQRCAEMNKPGLGGVSLENLRSGMQVVLTTAPPDIKDLNGISIVKPVYGKAVDINRMIKLHLQASAPYVITENTTAGAMYLLKQQLSGHMDKKSAAVLMHIVQQNMEPVEFVYHESGYDSNQPGRYLSSIVAEALLIGGYLHESGLAGQFISPAQVKINLASRLKLSGIRANQLAGIAAVYGRSQEYLFPGVTPSDERVPSLEDMALHTLQGNPPVSVRSLTGLGGVRYDREHNHIADFLTYLNMKSVKDRRYYPGMFLLLLSLQTGQGSVEHHPLFRSEQFHKLLRTIQHTPPFRCNNHSSLCSAVLIQRETLPGQIKQTNKTLPVIDAFHSPAYELLNFYTCFKNVSAFPENKIHKGKFDQSIALLISKVHRLYTFNSTIHLPWADSLAFLANGLIGQVKNNKGDAVVRFGIGRAGKSVELVAVNYAEGMNGYYMKQYVSSSLFEGDYEPHFISEDDHHWKFIVEQGFIRYCLRMITAGSVTF